MSEPNSETISNDNVKRILALLREGDEKINVSGYRDIVLIIGNTGSGKSTLTHFLAGNNDDLESIEVGEGSGEFIISDANNKISLNNTVISKTTVPELVIDHKTKTAYIDCPGFNDSRNEAFDIAAAYFIKKVLESVKNIKIVLTVSYPSLRKGVSRNDFLQLLEHVTILIKNIDEYTDSVSLIATKVDNQFVMRKGAPVLVPDTTVVENMAQFLREVKDSLDTMQNSDQVYTLEMKRAKNKLFFEKSKTLLETLLLKDGPEYSRLGIFRRPNVAGKLSEIATLQNSKAILKEMLKNHLRYSPVDMDNIGYTVSDKSKNIIVELVREINQNIIGDMSLIKNSLIEYHKDLEIAMYTDDMYSLRDRLKTTSAALSRISALPDSSTTKDLVSVVQHNLVDSCKHASKRALDDITNLGKFIDFLQQVSDKQFDLSAWKWIRELDEAVKYVDNSSMWYDFLASLHDCLSEYDIQKGTGDFALPALHNATDTLKNHDDLDRFFDQITNANFLKRVNLQNLKKVAVDETKLRYFDQVIASTLRDTLDFTFLDNNVLQITGEYVKLSDIRTDARYQQSQSVQIFAKHTIFIDEDVTKTNDLSIIAPRWEIIGNTRTINLDGSPGAEHVYLKAPPIYCGGCKGHDGAPGNPGESAGHFFGIGDSFSNATRLHIHAVGGRGGNGQHGGDGASGNVGNTYRISASDYQQRCHTNQTCSMLINYSKSGLFNLKLEGTVKYQVYGDPGERGGDCGHGGAAGLGGHPGTVTIFGVDDQTSGIVTEVAKGQQGMFGLHGTAGKGGQGGFNKEAYYEFGTWAGSSNYVTDLGQAPEGESGSCLPYSFAENANTAGLRHPASKDFLYSPSFIVSDYRNLLIKNLKSCVTKRRSLEFYQVLQNDKILGYDNVNLIYVELETLENRYNDLTPDITRLLYNYLEQRIQKLHASFGTTTNANERALLSFLSMAVASKLIRLENNSQSRSIVDQKPYFDLVKTADVNKIQQFFITRTNDEIKRVDGFVQLIRDDILNVIDGTTNEIVTLSQDDDNDELGDHLLKLKLFSNLKTLSQFLALFESLASADVSLINNISIASALPSPKMTTYAVDGAKIIAAEDAIVDGIENDIESVVAAVSKERRTLKSLGSEFDRICDQLKDAEIALQSRKPVIAKSYYSAVLPHIKDIFLTINTINSGLLNDANVQARDALKHFEKDVKLLQFDSGLYHDLMSREVDLSAVVSALGSVQERASALDRVKTDVFNLMSPVLHTVKRTLNGDLYKTDDLENLRRTISQTLDELKSRVYQMIHGFEVDEDLQLTTENLDEGINQLMTVYNGVLPSHQDRAYLHSFYFHLRSNIDRGSQPQNFLLKLVNANTLFYEYERLVDVYKKSVFPLDVIASNDLSLPSIPIVEKSSYQYQQAIASNVLHLESKLTSFQQNSQNYTNENAFNEQSPNGAFYVWRNENYSEAISRLLRGKRIILKASDTKGNREFLKFDTIGVRFRISDASMKEAFEQEIKNFDVVMTHNGNSYFTLCDHVQLLNQDSTRFILKANETTARVDSQSVPTPHTNIWNEEPNQDAVLSPFATWTFRLLPANTKANFRSLEPYRKAFVHLELEGHARYVNLENRAVCQKLRRNSIQLPTSDVTAKAASIDATPSKSTRKRREITTHGSKEAINTFKFDNPYYQSFSARDPLLLESCTEMPMAANNQTVDIIPTLNLLDYVIRMFTKVKHQLPKEQVIRYDEASIVALNIVDKFENILNNLPQQDEDNPHSTKRQQIDPTKVMGELEKHILAGDQSAIKGVLRDSVALSSTTAKYLEDELDLLLQQTSNVHTVHRLDRYMPNKKHPYLGTPYVDGVPPIHWPQIEMPHSYPIKLPIANSTTHQAH